MSNVNFDFRGKDLLDGKVPDPGIDSRLGIPKFIHQTWKSETLTKEQERMTSSWKKFHPDYLHILWTDEDNDYLVSKYPEYKETYYMFPLVIEKVDFTRLLYVYLFGGIYADLDFEAYKNITETLNEGYDVYLGKSYVCRKLLEYFQNSLIISKKNNDFINLVIQNISILINNITTKTNEMCYPYNKLFSDNMTKKIIHLCLVLSITGPNQIDKSVAEYFTNDQIITKTKLKPLGQEYFNGPLAEHHTGVTWCSADKIAYYLKEIILLRVFIGILIVIFIVAITLIIFYSCNKCCNKS